MPFAPHPQDVFTIGLAETAWMGDVRAEIILDGKVLDVVTVSADNTPFTHTEQFTFKGYFGGGPSAAHSLQVDLIDPAGGRTLFVNGMGFDGDRYNAHATMDSGHGSHHADFTFQHAGPHFTDAHNNWLPA